MKKLIYFFTAFCLVAFAACKKDGDMLIVSGLESSDLLTSETDIILSQENKDASVLALSWNESELSLSNEAMNMPSNMPDMIIEISANEDFQEFITIEPESNIYSFTGGQLNTIAKNFGFTPGESTPVYFRIESAYSSNTSSYYSNVISVNVTCYSIDMSKGFILDSDKVETGFVLYSPESNGEYHGFVGSTAWGNWFMREGDGTVWGNDGVSGTPFMISSDVASMWNFWYPGLGGCYYTTLSTSSNEWTATYLPTLNVSGDVVAEMTFDRAEVKWYLSVTTTTDNATVQVSCADAKLYNLSTNTDDAAAITQEIGFVVEGENKLSISTSAASAGNITFGAAGDYTLTFHLADPTNWYYEITSGLIEPEDPIIEYLYLPGIDDGITGAWNFDNYLRLISEDDLTYAGVVYVNSLWGYNISIAIDDWDNVYKIDDTEGTLVFQGANNIPAPSTGLYLIQADLTNFSYNHTEITDLSYSGFNDDWNLVSMTPASVDGVFTSSVTINAASEWGGKLYMNNNWDLFFGGAEGSLAYGAEGITDDASLATGTYDLIANLKDQTYYFLGDEIYVGGLNDVWDFTSVVLTKQSTGVYTGSATLSADSPWGMTIYLYYDNWDKKVGGSFDSMEYLGENMPEVQNLELGTYNITVDFVNNTCDFELQ